MSERVLITGASGFVGGHLAREIAAAGSELLAVSRRGTSVAGEGRAVDLLDSSAIDAAVADFQPTVVYHLAALASTGRSWQDPARCVGDNQTTTWNLLEAVRTNAPDATVVVAGSGESYGAPLGLPVDEQHPLVPATPYAVAKTVTDLVGGLFAEAHGLRVIRARAFNQIGPNQGKSFLLGSIAGQLKEQAGEQSAVVLTGSADVRRDYTDVRDVVRAMRLLVEAGELGAFNICSGHSLSTAEIVTAATEASSPLTVVHEVDPRLVRPHETADIVGDPTKLIAATGWQPLIPLSQSVSDALASA